MSFSIRTFVILSTCFFNKYFSSEADDDDSCCCQCCRKLCEKCLKKNNEAIFLGNKDKSKNNNNFNNFDNFDNNNPDNNNSNNIISNNNNINNEVQKVDENSFSSKNSELDNNNSNNIISNNNNDYNNNKNININFENNNKTNNDINSVNQNNNNIFNNFDNFDKNNQINNNFININNQLINNNNNNINNNNINNNINNEVQKVDGNDIIKLGYQIPPNIGLNNVGATCFMNSTLQCLSHTKKLTNYFLNPLNQERIIKNNIALENPNDLQLAPFYWELISNLWAKDGQKNYSPYKFMNRIQEMNPLFQKGQAGDAKDFIIYILEQMHRELKKNVLENKVELEPLNQYNKNNAFQHFWAEFQEGVSIISDIFFGVNETTNICLNCKNKYSSRGQNYPIVYNYEVFNCIIFPLEEVKKITNKFMQLYRIQDNKGLNGMNNNRVSLIECFVYNQKPELFTNNSSVGGLDNRNHCNICGQLCDFEHTSRIYVSPNVLVLILNRGKGNIFDVKLDFPQNIDIADFVILKDKPRITYNLYGVVTHIGESGPYAHFVASCKSPVDGLWYRFNDGLVYPIKDFQNEVHDYYNPYILFYQKDE